MNSEWVSLVCCSPVTPGEWAGSLLKHGMERQYGYQGFWSIPALDSTVTVYGLLPRTWTPASYGAIEEGAARGKLAAQHVSLAEGLKSCSPGQQKTDARVFLPRYLHTDVAPLHATFTWDQKFLLKWWDTVCLHASTVCMYGSDV